MEVRGLEEGRVVVGVGGERARDEVIFWRTRHVRFDL